MATVVESVQELVWVAIIAVVVILVIRFRERILLALTGDDRLHGSFSECAWVTCFRCCGQCSGEWTRHLTRCCCCPRRYRGINLVKAAGQSFGVASTAVELKNIVVGDLPYMRTANFFIGVECSHNPPMVSSLAEEVRPKVVHFPEVFTLRLRDNPFEQKVRIVVKTLHLVGSEELCECLFNAQNVLDWSVEPKLRRFQMKVMDKWSRDEAPTPPWIAVEFDAPHEARDLEYIPDLNTVRTATQEGTYRDSSVANFKGDYQLLDTSGKPMLNEPNESDLAELNSTVSRIQWGQAFCNFWCILLVILWALVRTYSWSCYRGYRVLTAADLLNEDFPLSIHDQRRIHDECEEKYGGLSVSDVPCRPRVEQIITFCKPREEDGSWPPEQPRPTVFDLSILKLTGIQVTSLRCSDKACGWYPALHSVELFLDILCILLLLAPCIFRIATHFILKRKKARMLNKQRTELDEMRRGPRPFF